MSSIIAAIAAHAIGALTMTHVPPSSPIRLLAVFAAVATSVYGVSRVNTQAFWSDAYSQYMLGYCIHAVYILYLRSCAAPSQLSLWSRHIWSVQRLFNPRDIPAADQKRSDDDGPTERKLKRRFVIGRLKVVVCCLAIRWIAKNVTLDMDVDDFISVRHAMLRRLTDMDLREWVVRVYLTAIIVFIPYLEFRAAHSLMSVIAVSFFDQDVSQWPDLFGKISAACTVRGFWADFWHRLMRKAFVSSSGVIVYNVLGVRSRKLGRLMITILIFVISGVMHAAIDYIHVPDMCKTPAAKLTLRHYCFTVFAVVLEDIVVNLALVMGIGGSGGKIWRVLGYCWTVTFFVWALPKMAYPSLLCQAVNVHVHGG